ncbi:hypothetical protein SVAN01_08890 [Stagonosporopsis vannaccii]|nr:hypothetical protein SVAN01_08890 [Stagonosporopsis vannaccii]
MASAWPRTVALPVMRSVVRHWVRFCSQGVQPSGRPSQRILRTCRRQCWAPVCGRAGVLACWRAGVLQRWSAVQQGAGVAAVVAGLSLGLRRVRDSSPFSAHPTLARCNCAVGAPLRARALQAWGGSYGTLGTHLAPVAGLPRPLRVGQLALDAAREVVVAGAVVQARVRARAGAGAGAGALERRGEALRGVLDALDLAGVGEARVVVAHALRPGGHDGCECGIFRVAPQARATDADWPACSNRRHGRAARLGAWCLVLGASQAGWREEWALCYGEPADATSSASILQSHSNLRCSAKGTRINSSPCATHLADASSQPGTANLSAPLSQTAAPSPVDP